MIKIKDGFEGERELIIPKMILDIIDKDNLLSAIHITDIGYYPNAFNHFINRQEPINQYVYIHCVKGKGWYQINGCKYQVSANQYFILPAGIPHSYAADANNPWTIYWIHFRGEMAKFYFQNTFQPIEIKPEVNSRINDRITIFEEMFNTLSNGYSMNNLYYASSLLHYYLGSLKYCQQYRNSNNQPIENNNMVDISIHFMKENIEKHLSLNDLANEVNYSPSHYSLLFKEKIGHTPLSYFNLLKIQEACNMLDSTNMKINQICYKVGIEDTFYFSRLFSKIMGMSPKEYRSLNKG